MKLSTSTSGDALVEWLNTFAKGVNAGSGGRIKAEVYPASQLGSIPRTIEGVALGTIEMSFNASGFYEPLEPRFAVLSAPGLFDSQEHGFKVLKDPAIRQRLASFGAPKGVEALTIFIPSQYVIVSHKPINTLADFKGQKIRVPGSPLQIEPLKRFGASPLSMPFGEVLPALQNRTIDGVWAGTTLFTALKFYDIAKTMTYLPSHWAATVPLVKGNFIDFARKAGAPISREDIEAFYLRGEKPVGVLKALRTLDEIIGEPDDLYRMTREYLEDAAAHGVRYAEFFWNPTGTARVSRISYQ